MKAPKPTSSFGTPVYPWMRPLMRRLMAEIESMKQLPQLTQAEKQLAVRELERMGL